MPLDDRMRTVLDRFAGLGPVPLTGLTPANARNSPTLGNAVAAMALPSGGETVHHRQIPGGDGELLARIFTPEGAGPFPVLVYFHGGGWVIANLDVYEPSCRALCRQASAIVVSVAYRLAPEFKFPAAVDDAYASLQWVLANAAALGGDASRIFVGGESAGGNLATVCCLKALAEGGKLPIGQVLIYPVTDASNMDRPSYRENAESVPLNAAMMPWFFGHYLASAGQRLDPHVSPLLAKSLTGMPPALVITAEYDPLRDEGEAYAGRLREFGVAVQSTRYEGVAHEFFGLAGVVDKADRAVAETARWMKDVTERPSSYATAAIAGSAASSVRKFSTLS
jgi:acetyl esterase